MGRAVAENVGRRDCGWISDLEDGGIDERRERPKSATRPDFELEEFAVPPILLPLILRHLKRQKASRIREAVF